MTQIRTIVKQGIISDVQRSIRGAHGEPLAIVSRVCRNLGPPLYIVESQVKPTRSRLPVAALAAGLISVIASCTHVDEPPATKPAPEDTTVVKMPMNLNGQIAFSIKDLAQRLDVPPDTIKVSGARQVTWRSGALGCPEPGMNYTQALVPGSVIYLQVDNAIHAYHGKIGSEPFYCPRERAEQPVLDDDSDPT